MSLRVLYCTALLLAGFSHATQTNQSYEVISELNFSESTDLSGWTPQWSGGKFLGKVGVTNNVLRIATHSDPGGQAGNWGFSCVRYEYGFSLKNETVKIAVDVAGQTLDRDMLLILTPKTGNVHQSPSVWINIVQSHKGTILIRRFEQGLHRTLKRLESTICLGGASRVVLSLTNGIGTLNLSRDGASESFDLGVLVEKEWIAKPFTVLVGTALHGEASSPAILDVRKLRISSTNPNEPGRKHMMGNGPGKDDAAIYLSLDGVANRRFQDEIAGDGSDGWTDQGANDMRYIPGGYQFFRGVPFFIREEIDAIGNERCPGAVILKGENTSTFPMQSKPIMVNSSAKWLYFLHTSAWGIGAGHIADYVIRYADDSELRIPISEGREIADWWDPQTMVLSDAVVAWLGRNEIKYPVGFYLFKWHNPNSDKKIKEIVFASTDSKATPILIAATASDKEYKIGSELRIDKDVSDGICEYRQRHKTSLFWHAGPQAVTVQRRLPIADACGVKSARIDVIRYHAEEETTVTCTLTNQIQKKTLAPGESKAVFLFTDDAVLQYIEQNKECFDVSVTFNGSARIGKYQYETNPNHHWIPKGEDVTNGTYAISGVFQVTGWLPIHEFSKYIELRPKPVQAKPVVIEETTATTGTITNDWLGSKLCLNGDWLWQPGGKVDLIPENGWQQIVVPCDVGELIVAEDKTLRGAWFKRDIFVPEQWRGRRLVLRFNGVADFAWVYTNGKKCGEHAGIQAFEVDVTDSVKFGENNTLQLYCENVYHGITSRKERYPLTGNYFDHKVTAFKGYAYRTEMWRGAWWLKPDEIELLYNGTNVAKKADSIEQVIKSGNGLYFRKQFWNHSVLYFSTPGNVALEKIKDRLEIQTNEKVIKHMTKTEPPHHWRTPYQARRTGPYQDISLEVTGTEHISDIFIKPSFRKMRLDVEMELAPVAGADCYATAAVMDADQVVLDMGNENGNSTNVVFSKQWTNPIIWRPSNPHLYYLKAEIHDRSTGNILDRQYVRFGFREFWIDGSRFMFNGKEFPMQGTSIIPLTPIHRALARWILSDFNQQGNINILRYHYGLHRFREFCDIADEMGMLMEMENPHTMQNWFWDVDGRLQEDQVKIVRDRSAELIKSARNHPSVVIWSADNENLLTRHAGIPKGSTSDEISQKWKDRFEIILKLNAAIKAVDSTRPIHNQGDEGFAYTDYWKDPRVEMLDIHYCQQNDFKNWKKKYGGKPAVSGEVSLGGPFAWTYQGNAWNLLKEGKDQEAAKQFWKSLNAGTAYIAQRIQFLRAGVKIPGVWPFGACLTYHPLMELWKRDSYGYGVTPDVPWPSYSGEQRKPRNHALHRLKFNYWDPKVPRSMHLRTYDALKDNFPEVEKLEPEFSPEVIVQVLDRKGAPLPDTTVWLFPEKQPGSPIGVISDAEGKAWFWCKAGAGSYKCWVRVRGQWFTTSVTPAPLGEWLQVKTVKMRVEI